MNLTTKQVLCHLANNCKLFAEDFKEKPSVSLGDIVNLGSVFGIVYNIEHLPKYEEGVYRVEYKLLANIELVHEQPSMIKTREGNILSNNKIIIFMGLSASGKDTVTKIISDNLQYNYIISTTTRPMREGESQGKPYTFVTKEEFFNRKMIESRKYTTKVDNVEDVWYYGVEENAILPNRSYVGVLDVQGTQEFIAKFGDRVYPIYLSCSDEIRKNRSISRGSHDEHEWNRREVADKESFKDVLNVAEVTVSTDSGDIGLILQAIQHGIVEIDTKRIEKFLELGYY